MEPQGQQGCAAALGEAARNMGHTLSTLGISTETSPLKPTKAVGYLARQHEQGGAPVSPVKALFCDDLQLQAVGEQSEAVVLHQLMQWTAQLLQRMLRAAEGATRGARADLEAAVQELVEERKQCASLLSPTGL